MTPASAAITRRLAFVAVGTVVAVAFWLIRSSTTLVWDDTPHLAANLYESKVPLAWGNPDAPRRIWEGSFRDIGGGYRPVSKLILWTGVAWFSRPDPDPQLWLMLLGAIMGLTAICVFLVARRFLRTDGAAALACALFLLSAPVVSAAWVVFSGIQILVPLLVCGGLLLYWKGIEAERFKWLWLAVLGFVLLVGPWVREAVGLLPLMIVVLEARRAGRPTWIGAAAVVFFLHALFPSALVKWTIYPDLPVHPVWAMGHLGARLHSAESSGWFSALKRAVFDFERAVPLHLAALFPPVVFGVLSAAVGSAWIAKPFSCQGKRWRWVAAIVAGLAVGAALDASRRELWIGVAACGLIVCQGMRRDFFLAFWFVIFLAPFLKVFTEQVHLAYALLPASIIVASSVEDVDMALRKTRGWRAGLRRLCLGLAVLAVADQAMNLYGSWRVVRACNEGILRMAEWFKGNVPHGSAVVANALHGEDIRWFSGDHVRMFWSVRAGIPRDAAAMAEPAELERLLHESVGWRPVYFLDIDYDYTPDRGHYHAHKYVRSRSVDMEKIGRIHRTGVRYPYLDPFKALVPRPFISFLGSPDLENDFYRGPAQDGTLFMREVYAEYHVCLVKGTRVVLDD